MPIGGTQPLAGLIDDAVRQLGGLYADTVSGRGPTRGGALRPSRKSQA
jgi:hypothetical protein